MSAKDIHTKGQLPPFIRLFQAHNDAYNRTTRVPVGGKRWLLGKLIQWLYRHYGHG